VKPKHFELFRPVCPVCRGDTFASSLQIATVEKQQADEIIEGILVCGNSSCRREYPIIDGIPIILSQLREYLKQHVFEVCQRRDLSGAIESILNDCCGPGSNHDTVRQHLSSYTWDHYGDLDPGETPSQPQPESQPETKPGGVVRLLEACLELAGELPPGPVLDLGCSVGRTSFEWARRTGEVVLGIDLNVPMLRLAGDVLRDRRVRYPRRRIGLVYDTREFQVAFPDRQLVDFWACDATALPLHDETFAAVSALNTLDCVGSPIDLLDRIAAVLIPGGKLLMASPYDWSASATAVEAWLGGHSQRGDDAGAAEPLLRRLLTPGGDYNIGGLKLLAERDVAWHVRMHQRSIVRYNTHCVAAEKSTAPRC
jgi:SAM-dependent methyltransferase/uncharacterized protein YbaR (Trm112 family)